MQITCVVPSYATILRGKKQFPEFFCYQNGNLEDSPPAETDAWEWPTRQGFALVVAPINLYENLSQRCNCKVSFGDHHNRCRVRSEPFACRSRSPCLVQQQWDVSGKWCCADQITGHLSPLTQQTAVVSTVRSLLGSGRHGQATLYLFQKH
jgi:hypothetical protein